VPGQRVVIAFVTPIGDKRRELMKLWCEEQLYSTPVYHSSKQPTNCKDDATLFLFGSVPPGALQPRDVFLPRPGTRHLTISLRGYR
jgi:hypothetical protein